MYLWLFNLFGFNQTRKSVDNGQFQRNKASKWNPKQLTMSSAVHWYFPLWSKWLFSGQAYCIMEVISNLHICKGNRKPFAVFTCGQSYKHFTIVINDPRVVTWAISRIVNYDRKVLYKIDHWIHSEEEMSRREKCYHVNIFLNRWSGLPENLCKRPQGLCA